MVPDPKHWLACIRFQMNIDLNSVGPVDQDPGRPKWYRKRNDAIFWWFWRAVFSLWRAKGLKVIQEDLNGIKFYFFQNFYYFGSKIGFWSGFNMHLNSAHLSSHWLLAKFSIFSDVCSRMSVAMMGWSRWTVVHLDSKPRWLVCLLQLHTQLFALAVFLLFFLNRHLFGKQFASIW